MAGVEPGISPDEASYFLNVAVIAGALIGLAFIALGVFMVDLLKRYEKTALPVFRDRETNEPSRRSEFLKAPDILTDRELVDGDPLAVFMAFSAAVAWSLFLLPLIIGLTAAWEGVRLWILAAEMFLFLGAFAFVFRVRSQKIDAIQPYRTREELLWPIMGVIALVLYGTTTGVLFVSALANKIPSVSYLMVWNRWGFSNLQASVFCLKVVCIVSLLFGTYNVNKDMFIFFKSLAAERMRGRWLRSFVEDIYPGLKMRVNRVIARSSLTDQESDQLILRWNRGPALISTHDFLDPAGAKSIWTDLLNQRAGTAGWMLDVPSIANWAAEMEHVLQTRELESDTTVAIKVVLLEQTEDEL